MIPTRTFGLLAGLLLGWPIAAGAAQTAQPGQPDSPEYRKAIELIRQLGSSRFQARELAARQIVQMGRAAKPALLTGRDNPDPEVADRCRKLLALALAADFQVRVDAFLADKEGKQEHDIPGWGRYQKLLGKDKDARDLFADILKNNQGLFIALEQDPKGFPQRYAARCQELTSALFAPNPQARTPLGVGDLAAVLFFGQDPGAARLLQGNVLITNLFWQPAFQNGVRTGPHAAALRKLFIGWLENRTDAQSVSNGLSIVQQLGMKEGVPFAARALRNTALQVFVRAQAMTVVGRLGDRSHLPLLEGVGAPAEAVGGAALAACKESVPLLGSLLDDESTVTNFNLNGRLGTVEMRDIALAMVIHLTGQNPREFGYEFLRDQPNAFMSYYFLGFADDDKKPATQKRAEARKKWNESPRQPAKPKEVIQPAPRQVQP